MRTDVEFVSTEFSAEPGEDQQINPGRYGKKLAYYVAQHLPSYGYSVATVFAEDWGWMIKLNNKEFSLWVGCGSLDEFPNGFLCFIEPSKPVIRKWFRNIDTTATVSKLSAALEALLIGSGKVSNLRWRSETEART